MKAKIYVTLKKGVLDPHGKAVMSSLSGMGIESVTGVRIGKYMEIELKDVGREEAQSLLDDLCRRLLANTVIEDYRIEIDG